MTNRSPVTSTLRPASGPELMLSNIARNPPWAVSARILLSDLLRGPGGRPVQGTHGTVMDGEGGAGGGARGGVVKQMFPTQLCPPAPVGFGLAWVAVGLGEGAEVGAGVFDGEATGTFAEGLGEGLGTGIPTVRHTATRAS